MSTEENSLSNEELLERALKNMVRKLNFRELYDSMLSNDITKSEYGVEIESNPDKYVIEMRDATKDEAWRVGLLAHRMKICDLTVSDIEEMFGLNLSKYLK